MAPPAFNFSWALVGSGREFNGSRERGVTAGSFCPGSVTLVKPKRQQQWKSKQSVIWFKMFSVFGKYIEQKHRNWWCNKRFSTLPSDRAAVNSIFAHEVQTHLPIRLVLVCSLCKFCFVLCLNKLYAMPTESINRRRQLHNGSSSKYLIFVPSSYHWHAAFFFFFFFFSRFVFPFKVNFKWKVRSMTTFENFLFGYIF